MSKSGTNEFHGGAFYDYNGDDLNARNFFSATVPPYSQQFNLTVEHQTGQNGIRVVYVGARSVDLIYQANINQPVPSAIPFTPSRYTYPNFNTVTWYDNGGTQEYNALQVSASKTYGKKVSFNTGRVPQLAERK